MKVLITGNRNEHLAKEVVNIFESSGHSCHCVSRSNGYDFEPDPIEVISAITELSLDFDIFINLFSNFFFNASVLSHKIFNLWFDKGFSDRRIINIGSDTDRVKKGKKNLHHYEKRTLRDMSTGHSILSVWNKAPKVTYISFGAMENRKEDHPGRKYLKLREVAEYIYWVTQQPNHLHIDELCISHIQ